MGHKNLMLVEGRNDQYVLRGLLQHHHIDCTILGRPNREYGADAIIIDQKNSVQGVLDTLKVILDDGDLERLAVIVDADHDIKARWDALKNILAHFGGQDIPGVPIPEGAVITLVQHFRTLRVGVWLMPNNRVPGILEDFIRFLVPDEQETLWQYAIDCVNNIPEKPLFPDIALPKAKIHTWLAWQKQPGQPLGIAITAKYLNADASDASNLINWVKQVFELS